MNEVGGGVVRGTRRSGRKRSWSLAPLCWLLPLMAWLISGFLGALNVAQPGQQDKLTVMIVGGASITLAGVGLLLSLVGLFKSLTAKGVLVSAVVGILLGGSYAAMFIAGAASVLKEPVEGRTGTDIDSAVPFAP